MTATRRNAWLAIGVLTILALIAGRRSRNNSASAPRPLSSSPMRVMGTECRLLAVPFARTRTTDAQEHAVRALKSAEASLRRVEAQMSWRIDSSPISRLNRARSGTFVPLPSDLLVVLSASRGMHAASRGAFDVMSGPLIDVWRAAAETGVLPDPDRIRTARNQSSWDHLTLLEHGAVKSSSAARVDLGGIAKGYGIDLAIDSMKRSDVAGGLVEVGGDLRVFGEPPADRHWKVKIRDPFRKELVLLSILIDEGAVCTSGDYFRYVEIGGQRYSHIVDPRSGWPARESRSSTVVAPNAMIADAWATTLSVLGPRGLDLLPEDIEGLVVTDEKGSARFFATKGFVDLIKPIATRTSVAIVDRSSTSFSTKRRIESEDLSWRLTSGILARKTPRVD